MKFTDVYFSREHRYSIGIESESERHYVSIPVSNGLVDYEEYYAISPQQAAVFPSDESAAINFVAECQRHEHDDLLIQKPGTNRGTPG
ncbi:hypothetical protein SBE55_14010 [Mycolicibacterium sp. 141076]|uniref:hypothetical protein n=1 Tax=Mycobacteriaceae TaxID=1762 RepID=UPI00299CE6AB|nr:hypothetical protein [Mycolicibacterium sp. 141076]MDX1878931.1 hypothetical protein [Mycolicibacterium sp. 141076]